MSTEEHQNTKDWWWPRYQPTKDTNKYNSFLQSYKTGIVEATWPFNHKNTSNLKLALPNPSYIYTKMTPMQDGSHNVALLSTKFPPTMRRANNIYKQMTPKFTKGTQYDNHTRVVKHTSQVQTHYSNSTGVGFISS